jgi:large subunit ribosomal protein L2
MGKRLRPQRRGKGGPRYRAPTHRYKFNVSYPPQDVSGIVSDIVNDPARTSVVARIDYISGGQGYIIAPEGIQVGQMISIGGEVVEVGNILPLGSIPEGTYIYNIEISPGDGGKLVRSSGTYAMVVSHEGGKTVIKLPSKQMKAFPSLARATVGVVSGGGRTEKPFVKSGKKFHAYQSKSMSHIHVRGSAMNPVNHPFGGGGHQGPGRSTTVSRHAPPGKKVGLIGAKRSGRK